MWKIDLCGRKLCVLNMGAKWDWKVGSKCSIFLKAVGGLFDTGEATGKIL